jgi:hypothetical protein
VSALRPNELPRLGSSSSPWASKPSKASLNRSTFSN